MPPCHKKRHGEAQGRDFGCPSLILEKTASTSADDFLRSLANGERMPHFVGDRASEGIRKLVKQIRVPNKP
jgi:hypothetical protein